jgi:glycosyltransferase involved in cell wall biosynthesis
MDVKFYTDKVVANDSATTQKPIKVCMHVLKSARNDVRVMRAATALVEAGYFVSIVDIEEKHTRAVEEEVRGVHLKHVMMPTSFITTRFSRWTLFRTVQMLIYSVLMLLNTPADVYHAHDVSGLPACYIAALLRRKPFVFDAHELPLAELSSGLFRRMQPVLRLLLVGLLSRCAGVITVSPPIVQEIRNRYHVSNVVLLRNIPPYQAMQKSDRLRRSLGSGSDVHIALYQGNLTAGRGLERLIYAAAFLERHTVIVMMGQGEMEPQLKALIAKEGVANRVKILPPAPYAELLDWTASAELGLMVYSLDHSQNVLMCLPNKLFEYLMAGLPVLASPLEAVVDVIEAYKVGRIVSSLSPKEIGEAINGLLADQQVCASMRHNALRASQEDLCWENEKSGLITFYSKLPGLRGADRSSSSISHVEAGIK